MGRRLGWLGGLTVAALVVAVPLPAGAAAGGYTHTNLVSDQPGVAQKTDPNVVNAWGMSRARTRSATSPVWVSGQRYGYRNPVKRRPERQSGCRGTARGEHPRRSAHRAGLQRRRHDEPDRVQPAGPHDGFAVHLYR